MAHVFHMLENKKHFIITLVFWGILLSCHSNNKTNSVVTQNNISKVSRNDSVSTKHKQESNQSIVFIPDSIINKSLILDNSESLLNFYSATLIETVEKVRESPVVIFSNKTDKEYLIAYHYEGDTKNAFACFEIGYFVNDKGLNRTKVYKTHVDAFKTESNLCLGMPFDSLVKIKGKKYKVELLKEKRIITYYTENSPYVKFHKMPGYFMKFLIINEKVNKITFGFEYP